ncbi:thiol:disulfide interchange protein DsbD [Bathymodiolus japonicus methanotrophic gill symbiont]|uniref:protein-disulfide reductase DsbD n=1 Tax=Bathymodiolus japonicus methanotrophic gill symbiont TaxID=113269 RepID=UPI001B50D118|nr:protein-disulfide reductase DsbD [Bathymodiolus japonicus methanotrophic gill symbiont]GFO72400.1 thiol:disulfide interchange protein DsbD [Bathymodiolus japonicus methanotrophic gill symbiont]
MHYLKFTFSCFFILVSQWVYAINPDQLLPPELAFKVSATATESGNVKVSWQIADGYYLYRKKISFSSKTDAVSIEQADLPAGKVKHDPNFGDMQIYRHTTENLLILQRPTTALPFSLSIKYQGCADLGLCYPPQRVVLNIDLPAQTTSAKFSGSFNPLDQLTKALGSGLSLFSSQLLPADDAFQFFATAKDGQTLTLQWHIADGYYLYREKFELQLPKGSTTDTDILAYNIPHGKEKYDEAFGDVELLYGDLVFDVPLARTNTAEHEITLTAKFQGCAERGVCYPPMQKTVNILLPAISAAAISGSPDVIEKAASEQDLIVASLQQDSFLLTLLSFLGFGLLLAFTPCVFPMIPILSGIIVGQGKDITHRKAFFLSLSFVLASAATYTVFGVLAALFGSNLQATFQAPWIIYLFSGIFVVLSFSMFGFFNLELPKSIQSRLHNASDKHRDGSFIGAALMGVFSSLIVGPCVAAPLAAALMYIGQTGDVILGGSALFVMGFGMGIPLLIIGASAGSLLPKAGHWLNASKTVFGVIMLAVAVWMLERVLAAEITMLFWAMLCIIPAIYLRVLDPLPEVDSGWHKLWKGFGVILFTYGLLILIGLSAGSNNPLQPLKGLAHSVSSQQQQPPLVYKRVASLAELNQQLQAASSQGKLVMLDFYADWCISCKEMEAYTLSKPKVRQALSRFVLLQADVTANNDQDKALLKAFNLIGPPAILFFNLDQQEQSAARVIGYQDAETFLQHLSEL